MIHHFYHIYADGNCEQPIREHVRALTESGLYKELNTFAIGLVGSPQKRQEAINCLHSLGVKFTIAAEADTGWEQVTQIPMWQFSQQNEGLMLYAHTKGASDGSDVNVRWRRSMTYWSIIRWRDCLKHLETHDMAGCHWIYPLISMPEHKYGAPMYAGTFWWVTMAQLRTWIKPPLTHRHEAEGWPGYKYIIEPFKLYDFANYFPNSGPFADDWINNPNFSPPDTGTSIEPVRI